MRSLCCGVICSKNSSTEVSLSHGEVLMAWSYPCVGTAQELRGMLYPKPTGLKAQTLEFIFSLMWSLHDMELTNGAGAWKNKHHGGHMQESLPRGHESIEGGVLQSLGVIYPQVFPPALPQM